MHFIDDIHLKAPLAGREVDIVAQLTNIIYAGVGSCIDLDQIQETPFVNRDAILTSIARPFAQVRIQAVDCFRQQACCCGLSCAAWTGKKISLADLIRCDSVFQRLDDMILTDDFLPGGWAPNAVESLRHTLFLMVPDKLSKLCRLGL